MAQGMIGSTKFSKVSWVVHWLFRVCPEGRLSFTASVRVIVDFCYILGKVCRVLFCLH